MSETGDRADKALSEIDYLKAQTEEIYARIKLRKKELWAKGLGMAAATLLFWSAMFSLFSYSFSELKTLLEREQKIAHDKLAFAQDKLAFAEAKLKDEVSFWSRQILALSDASKTTVDEKLFDQIRDINLENLLQAKEAKEIVSKINNLTQNSSELAVSLELATKKLASGSQALQQLLLVLEDHTPTSKSFSGKFLITCLNQHCASQLLLPNGLIAQYVDEDNVRILEGRTWQHTASNSLAIVDSYQTEIFDLTKKDHNDGFLPGHYVSNRTRGSLWGYLTSKPTGAPAPPSNLPSENLELEQEARGLTHRAAIKELYHSNE